MKELNPRHQDQKLSSKTREQIALIKAKRTWAYQMAIGTKFVCFCFGLLLIVVAGRYLFTGKSQVVKTALEQASASLVAMAKCD